MLFQLPEDLKNMPRNQEYDVMFDNGLWYTAVAGAPFTMDSSCQALTVDENADDAVLGKTIFIS